MNLTEFDLDTIQPNDTSLSLSSHHNHTATKQQHEILPNDGISTEAEQLVKPSKIHIQPLHAEDLLYESTKFEPGAGQIFLLRLFFIFLFGSVPIRKQHKFSFIDVINDNV